MNHRGIRNLDRFNEAREKDAKKRELLVTSTYWNIIAIVNDHHGELEGRTKVEALDILIRHGVFGASSKFPIRVSRHRKQEHRQNIAMAAPTEVPDGYQGWYAIVTEALDQLETAAAVTIDNKEGSYRIRTTVPAETSALQRQLEQEFGHVVETPDPIDPDEVYNPLTRLDGRLLRTVGRKELIAY
jgi:hypothetical protein